MIPLASHVTELEKSNSNLKNQTSSQEITIKQLINNTSNQLKFNKDVINWANSVEKRIDLLNNTSKLSK